MDMQERIAAVQRSTNETSVQLTLNLDGSGRCECKTGIGFFDHMLDGFARHGLFDLALSCAGDLEVDCHHTVEDVGIVLGRGIRQALGEKRAIKRYGSCILPMDDALILCAVDLSGRPYLQYDVDETADAVGEMAVETVREFFYAVSYSAEMNLHLKKISGINQHHITEGCFKAFAKALDAAIQPEPRVPGVWSTKGTL